MSNYTIFHNPRCSKSRQTLALLEENGIEPEIRLYLENPPTADELRALLAQLGIDARSLLRKGEDEYKALKLNDLGLSDAELINAMANHPRLIERPIVTRVSGSKRSSVLGRPPENVLEIL
ncbi:MAG: arsenate reductase (glutaredoxin) [Pseudomonadales bacterium]